MKKTAKNGRGRASEGDWSPIDGLAFSRDALTAWRAQSRENRAFARAALRDRPSGRADRATAQGNTVWSLAWEGGGEMLESLERLWPEGASEAARNGLAQLARFLEGAGDDNDEPNYLRRFYFAGSLPAMLEALGERPEAVGARARLSSLLDSLGRGGSEEFYWARRLEQEAGCEEERVILEEAISTEGLRSGSRAGL